jgi:ABC-type branched-subunit amino acid transport system ATPase component
VVGGSQHVWGGVLGTGLITMLREWLSDLLPGLIGAQGNFEVIFFGVLVILTLQFARRGLWPLVERVLPQEGTRLLPERGRLPEREKPGPGTPLLQVEHAVKTFGGLRAVNDVSFELRAGEILGLIGPNGAGKSTLFNLITGVSPASAGRTLFMGQDITRRSAGQIHRLGLARTFQHVHLLPDLSLLANTMMGGYARGRAGMVASLLHLERAEEAALQHEALRQLVRVGLGDQAFSLAGNLALGQQRILEVARALVADPTLLLLDEPAAGLRYGEKAELITLLKRLRDEGVTILLVEHDMDLVMSLVDRLVVMNSGEKLAEGTPDEVRGNAAVREAYLGVDMTGEVA